MGQSFVSKISSAHSLDSPGSECPICRGTGIVNRESDGQSNDGTNIRTCPCIVNSARREYLSDLPLADAESAVAIPIESRFLSFSPKALASVRESLWRMWYPRRFLYLMSSELWDIHFERHPLFPSVTALVNGKERLFVLNLFQNTVDFSLGAQRSNNQSNGSFLDKVLANSISLMAKNKAIVWIISSRSFETLTFDLPITQRAIAEQGISVQNIT